MVKINDNIWFNIGCTFCNIRRSFIIKYKNDYKDKKNINKYKKYYIDFFEELANLFDCIIGNFYNNEIDEINGVNITKIFYNYYENDELLNNNQLLALFNGFNEIIIKLNNDNNYMFDDVIKCINKHLAGLIALLN
jgi:hypothetical protein